MIARVSVWTNVFGQTFRLWYQSAVSSGEERESRRVKREGVAHVQGEFKAALREAQGP
jgi:hypothetical protein